MSISVLLFYYFNLQNKRMIERIASKIPEGYFDPNIPSAWRIIIKVNEQIIRDMETLGYKQREQEKMKKLGLDITITDDMLSERYLEIKKELDFAKKQLKRLIGQRQN